jgi:Ca-activated chloride channel family protein
MKKKIRQRLRKGGWALALGCVALAAGGIVLLRAPGHAAPRTENGLGGFATDPGVTVENLGPTKVALAGPGISGHLAISQGAVLANGTRRVMAELRLTAAEDGETAAERQPVALAVVLDVSGSMHGEKIAQAKNAVRQLVERMRDEDHVALVTYDHETYVIQPLARVGSVRHELYGRIAAIQPGGGTVIPQALTAGARALEGAPENLVRRMVLLSDGLDGSGQSVEMVSSQVRTRATQGVATSSLGIGVDYDERFMTSVADAGRGNYEFLANGGQLQAFLRRELDQASTTVVDHVATLITLPSGVRVARAHGGDVNGTTGQVRIPFGPLPAGGSRRAVLELEIVAGAPGGLGELGATVDYRTVADSEIHQIGGAELALAVVGTEAEVAATRNEEVYAETWAVVIDAEQKDAIQAWRDGDARRARNIAQQNVQRLRRVQAAAPSAAPRLEGTIAEVEADEDAFDSVSASSSAGRAYGLRSNAQRRARVAY